MIPIQSGEKVHPGLPQMQRSRSMHFDERMIDTLTQLRSEEPGHFQAEAHATCRTVASACLGL